MAMTNKKKKIAVVTGARSDYGLLYGVIKGILKDPALKLQLIVTGMHLSPEFGLTVNDIEKDGFPIAERVRMPLLSDTEEAIAESMGRGMTGFARAYERLEPDIIIVLGDRFEILAAVAAALPFRIPVAHIHGGEAAGGVIDEQIRHATTKMSHIHFTSAQAYKRRVIQMGESPENVFCFGAPGLENIDKMKLMKSAELCEELKIPRDKKIGVITYHPVTLEKGTASCQIDELLDAVKGFTDIYWVFTLPNADTGGRVIIRKIKAFIKKHPDRGKFFASLGQLRYFSLLKNAAIMVGNSSSGLIEAPSFELPVVNIGDRQLGRIRARNVIDVPACKRSAIAGAIARALSAEFKRRLKGMKNPCGGVNVSKRIISALKKVRLGEHLVKKRFYDIAA